MKLMNPIYILAFPEEGCYKAYRTKEAVYKAAFEEIADYFADAYNFLDKKAFDFSNDCQYFREVREEFPELSGEKILVILINQERFEDIFHVYKDYCWFSTPNWIEIASIDVFEEDRES